MLVLVVLAVSASAFSAGNNDSNSNTSTGSKPDTSTGSQRAEPPNIAATIKPLHSLVAAVTEGVSKPVLLFDGYTSPHTAQLKPSTLRTMLKSDVLVWVGAGVEGYLSRVVADLEGQIGVVTLGLVDGMERLSFRGDDHSDGHADDHSAHDDHARADEDDDHDTHAEDGKDSTQDLQQQSGQNKESAAHSDESQAKSSHGSEAESDQSDSARSDSARPRFDQHLRDHVHDGVVDFHLWLDPYNAMQFVHYFAEYLAEMDVANAAIYQQNAEQLIGKLQALDQQLQTLFADLSEQPYLVFHDSFQYLEHRYGLHRASVIAIQPEVQPGAQRLRKIQQQIKDAKIGCLFSEPQFPAKVVSMLQRDASLHVATIDPLASRYDAGPQLYVQWMSELAGTMRDCLSR